MSTDRTPDDDLVADADAYLKQEAAPDQQKQDGGQLSLQAMQAIDGLSLRREDLKLQIEALRAKAKKSFEHSGDVLNLQEIEELLADRYIDSRSLRQEDIILRIKALRAKAENKHSGDVLNLKEVEELLEIAYQNYLLYSNAKGEYRSSSDKTVLVSSNGELLDEMPAYGASAWKENSGFDMEKRRKKESDMRYIVWQKISELHELSLEAVTAQKKIHVIEARITSYKTLIKRLTGIDLDIPPAPQS